MGESSERHGRRGRARDYSDLMKSLLDLDPTRCAQCMTNVAKQTSHATVREHQKFAMMS